MALVDVLQQYFRSERAMGFVGTGVGLLVLAIVFWIWRNEGGSFATGLMIPLLILGLGGALGAPFLVIRTDRQVAELSALPDAKIREIEKPRMAKVNANWAKYKVVWTALIAIALVLIWAVKRDWALGLGLGLLILCAFIFTVDVFAERRAEIYAAALEKE